MARGTNKLTAKAIEKKAWKPGVYADGLGLYLQVSTSLTKAWLFRYMRDGKARKMGLGSIHDVTLAEARDEAAKCRKQLHQGIDPLAARLANRSASRLAIAKTKTFKECAREYIADHEGSWKNQKHRDQWPASLEKYAYPVLGALPVGEIDLALVLKVIKPIWKEKPETASRVRGRIEIILGWATTHGLRRGDNPARWRGHLENLLPARKKGKHHAALPYSALPGFMSQLRGMEGTSAKALEFAILTATRTNETLEAEISEIDFANSIWVIPAERMKAGREHRVPLSKLTLAILNELKREKDNPYLFVGPRKGKPLSSMALLMTLRRMKQSNITVHGFRSTFRDWCAERTAYPNEMQEMALAHVIDDKTEAAYRRGDMLDKRRRMMADWANFCEAPEISGEVVPLRSQIGG